MSRGCRMYVHALLEDVFWHMYSGINMITRLSMPSSAHMIRRKEPSRIYATTKNKEKHGTYTSTELRSGSRWIERSLCRRLSIQHGKRFLLTCNVSEGNWMSSRPDALRWWWCIPNRCRQCPRRHRRGGDSTTCWLICRAFHMEPARYCKKSRFQCGY